LIAMQTIISCFHQINYRSLFKNLARDRRQELIHGSVAVTAVTED